MLPGRDLGALAQMLATGDVTAELRESAHYAGGEYLVARVGDTEVRIEWVADGEFLIDADQGEPQLSSVAEAVSAALAACGVRHRVELYEGESLVRYLHYDWSNTRR
jgi:hypothetical protein